MSAEDRLAWTVRKVVELAADRFTGRLVLHFNGEGPHGVEACEPLMLTAGNRQKQAEGSLQWAVEYLAQLARTGHVGRVEVEFVEGFPSAAEERRTLKPPRGKA